jgi:hypothetical protein
VHLKKLRRAEGGAKNFGVFRVKNHDFTPKNHIFSNEIKQKHIETKTIITFVVKVYACCFKSEELASIALWPCFR